MPTTWNTNSYAGNGLKILIVAALMIIMFICDNIFKKAYFFWIGIVLAIFLVWFITMAVFAAAEKISQ